MCIRDSADTSHNQHAVPIAEEAIALTDRLLIRLHHQLLACECADKHDERGLRQMEIREQTAGDTKLKTGMNEDVRAALGCLLYTSRCV